MRFLLDTHAFIWYITDHPELSDLSKENIRRSENEILLSAGSLWEMAIKIGLGKLQMPRPFDQFIEEQMRSNAITLLPIQLPHLEAYITLPFHHKDPFDRLIIAQALTERVVVLTKDAEFGQYGVTVQW